MSRGHPQGLPDLFLDRSLGCRQVPALLRDEGLRLLTLREVFGVRSEGVDDTEWLEVAGRNGWAVLMKDHRIRYRHKERAALRGHGVRAFCVLDGNLLASEMARRILSVIDDMVLACGLGAPSLHLITAKGLRPVPLVD